MRFGELVEIMAADPARRRIDQRDDRQLNHRQSGDQAVEDAQLAGIDDVFGVVEDDRLEAHRRCLLMGGDRAPQRIEAIGLGRRARTVDDGYRDTRVADRGNRVKGRPVVGIGADEYPEARIVEPRGQVAEHRADDRRLVPRRDDDRHPPAAIGDFGGDLAASPAADG